MDRPKSLVVGINSFLGRAIYDLIKSEYDIIGVYNQNKENIPDGIKVIQVDSIEDLKDICFTHIYLVGAYIPENKGIHQFQKLISANIELPGKVSKLFPFARIVYCSTVSVYENYYGDIPISLDLPPTPKSMYALSKLWGERIIEYHSSYVILRISSIYGAGMRLTTFIPLIIKDVILNKRILLLGDGSRRQNYMHVDDVAVIAVKAAMKPENMTLLAVNDYSYSNLEIANMVLSIIPGRLLFKGQDNSSSFMYDNSYTKQMLSNLKFKNIKVGLNELIEWIQKKC